jgi:DNA-binding FadR family transcriptional regulator
MYLQPQSHSRWHNYQHESLRNKSDAIKRTTAGRPKNLSYVLAEKLAQRILAGKYAPGSILPGEMELGEQFGVSRTAVREAVKTLTAKGMVLPRPRIGTRVMPQSNWNFLDQELLSWWMTEDNFHQVVDHFLVMRSSLEPQACLLAATLGTAEQKAQLNALMEEMVFLKSTSTANAGLRSIWPGMNISI